MLVDLERRHHKKIEYLAQERGHGIPNHFVTYVILDGHKEPPLMKNKNRVLYYPVRIRLALLADRMRPKNQFSNMLHMRTCLPYTAQEEIPGDLDCFTKQKYTEQRKGIYGDFIPFRPSKYCALAKR